MIRILLVDDHEMIREGLRVLLNGQSGMEVIGEANNGRQALDMIQKHAPDVVVMDLHLPELNGIDATRQAKAHQHDLKVVCMSANYNEKTVSEVLDAGAAAYVLKESAFEELTTAIKAAVRNRTYLSPSITSIVVDRLRKKDDGVTAGPILSTREREVLQMIAEGKTAKDIANRLNVSVKTIETHRRNIMEKLGVDSVAELTKYAVREGLTSL